MQQEQEQQLERLEQQQEQEQLEQEQEQEPELWDDDEDGEEEGDEEGWEMPETFVPLPPGFSRQQPAAIDLRRLSHAQLRAAAAPHTTPHLPRGAGDPGGGALAGVAERAALRPGAAPPVAFSMGGVPKGTAWSKAWAAIGRSAKPYLLVRGQGRPLCFLRAARAVRQLLGGGCRCMASG